MSLFRLSSLVSLLVVATCFSSVACTHTVNIRSEPAGAEILVNGVSQGKAPVAYTETSSGGGTVDITARLNGQETTQKVPKDQINWAAVGGAGGGGGGAACVALNAAGCLGFVVGFGILALPLNCLGLAVGVGVPLGVYFAAGQQMKEDIVINMGSATPVAPPAAAPAPTSAPPMPTAPQQSY